MPERIKIYIKKVYIYFKSKAHRLVPGMLVFFCLFLLSNVLNLSLSYMGNTNEEVAREIIRRFWGTILIQTLKVLGAYLFIGAALGGLFYQALKVLQGKFCPFRALKSPGIISALLALAAALLIFAEKLIVNPQLYLENFAAHGVVPEKLQHAMTDNLSPLVFSVPFVILVAGALFITILPLLTRDRAMSVITAVRGYRFRLPAAGAALLALTIVLLYRADIIFYSVSSQPNIIILSSDAVRPDRLSVNGYPRETTPAIDRITSESLQFRGVMTATPRTFPAWVSVLTSQYPLSHNIKHMFPRSRERNVTFDSVCGPLNERGYLTAVVSDFAGDIFPRIDLGFQKVLAPTLNFPVLVRQIILEKQTFLMPFLTNPLGRWFFPEMRGIAKYSQHDRVTAETIDLIESARGGPFFITAFYSITHFPFAAPHPYYGRYADRSYRGPYKYYKQVVIQMGDGDGAVSREDTDADRKQVNDLYDGCLSLFDREVGALYAYLERRGLLDNTIIVITADHGENLYEPGLGMGHGEHLKGYPALEVPFIVRPQKGATLKKGTRGGVFSAIDIMPTVFEIAGIPRQDFFRGRSLVKEEGPREGASALVDAYCETGLWFDNNKKTRLFFQHQRIDYPDVTGISELETRYNREVVIQQKFQNITNAAKYRTIFHGGFKLIYIPLPGGVRFELYDQIKDPLNNNELSAKKPELLAEMKKRFFEFIISESNNNFIVNRDFLFPLFADPVF